MNNIENDKYYISLIKQNKATKGALLYLYSNYKLTPSEFVKEYSEEKLDEVVQQCFEPGHKLNMIFGDKRWSSEPIDTFFDEIAHHKRAAYITSTLSSLYDGSFSH